MVIQEFWKGNIRLPLLNSLVDWAVLKGINSVIIGAISMAHVITVQFDAALAANRRADFFFLLFTQNTAFLYAELCFICIVLIVKFCIAYSLALQQCLTLI